MRDRLVAWCEDGPLPLALLRVAVAVIVLLLPLTHAAASMAGLPPNQTPWGIGWLVPFVDPTLARLAYAGVIAGAVVGGLGLLPRAGMALLAVCGAYLYAIPQLRGGVQHDHHLVWFAALLAASPCGDAITPWQPRPAAGRSLAWGLPVRVAWALIACIFFFPGVHKLAAQGPAWAFENLRWLFLWKWTQAWDFTPLVRLDLHPWLLGAGGLGVLAFELTAPFAMVWARTRVAFVVAAVTFHAATSWFFDIDFWVLWPCYVVLVPLPAIASTDAPPARSWRPAAVVGGLLLAGAVGTGVAGVTQAWPFACYPTFEQPVGPWMPTLLVVAVDDQGLEHELPERALADPWASQSFYGEAWGLAGHYGVDDPVARRAFWQRVAARPAVRAALAEVPPAEIRMYRAWRSVDPERPEVRRGDLVDRFPP